MTFYKKIKWILGILMIFVLIIATNLIDRSNFLQVKNSVVTIYEDRLIAKDLIFEMSNAIQEKQLAVAVSDTLFFSERNALINKNLNDFILRFEQTKLTKEEGKLFKDLKNNLNTLSNYETSFIASDFIKKEPVSNQISKIKVNLYKLSKIQLNEGKRQMSISEKAINSVELFTQIEIYILIFLAILIQIIVIYKPKED